MIVFPGYKIGVIEEYIGEQGTYIDDYGCIRSKYLGFAEVDLEKHRVQIKPLRKLKLINIGDEIIGRIFNISGVFGYVKINIVNGIILDRQFTGIVYPHRIVKNVEEVYRIGDYIFSKVVSKLNRAIHLSIKEDRYGVIYTKCSICGSEMIRVSRNKLKCKQCSNTEERKLSNLYGKINPFNRQIVIMRWY